MTGDAATGPPPFDPERVEELQRGRLLDGALAPNATCEYGRGHGFARIDSVDAFRDAVPLVDYETLRAQIERMAGGERGVLVDAPVRRFFVTSGSTGRPKLVPVTRALIADKSRIFTHYWQALYRRHPGARDGTAVTNFSDSGAGERTVTTGGIATGSESAFWSAWTSGLRRAGRYPLTREIGSIASAEARYYAIARVLLEENVTVLMTLNPSTIVLLLQSLCDHADSLIRDVRRGGLGGEFDFGDAARTQVAERYRGDAERAERLEAALRTAAPRLRAADVWPGLAVVACWRSPMLRPYLRLIEPHLGDRVAASDYVSMASEGILALPLEDGGSGGLLAVDTHFYEFIPLEEADRPQPRTRLAHELEQDCEYVVVLTTSGGLYRYKIGDVIRVTGFVGRTPRIEFRHRFGATSSLTGEKLTEAQVVDAVSSAARSLTAPPAGFTAFPAAEPFPHYVLLFEPAHVDDRDRTAALAAHFDRELGRRNVEYASKRESRRLGAPEVWIAAAGSYARWRQRRVDAGANDVQVKSIHLSRDPAFPDSFEIVSRHVAN